MAALDSPYPRSTQGKSCVEPVSSPLVTFDSDSPAADSTITNGRDEGPRLVSDEAAPQRWGNLQRLEKIGQGEFGEVYRAWDSQLEREVALKLCRTGVRCYESCIRRGLREARLLARVRHPNVVTVYGAEGCEGRFGVWMEYIRGW